MKRMIKYAAVVFALVLAASIIGGCLTAGVAVVQAIVEKTGTGSGTESSRGDGNADTNNDLWHRDENGDIIFLGTRFGSSGAVKSGSEEFSGSEIDSLDVEGLSGELIIEAWDKDTISVVYENIAEEYKIKNDDGVLKISCDKDWFSFNVSPKELPKIHIQVPAGQEFREIMVDKGSGSLKLSGVKAEEMEIDSGSGSVNISDIAGEELLIDSGSGFVNASDIAVKKFRVNSGSGAVAVERLTAEKTVLDSGSGTVTVKNSVTGETSVDTGSGFVNFEETSAKNFEVESGSGRVNYTGELAGNCVFDTSSGSVNLELYGAEEEYNIRADLGSGGLYINGAKERDTNIEYEDADNDLVFDTGSGRVSIKFHSEKMYK